MAIFNSYVKLPDRISMPWDRGYALDQELRALRLEETLSDPLAALLGDASGAVREAAEVGDATGDRERSNGLYHAIPSGNS